MPLKVGFRPILQTNAKRPAKSQPVRRPPRRGSAAQHTAKIFVALLLPAAALATLPAIHQPRSPGKSVMTQEHAVSRIARLVYDCADPQAALAAELRIDPAEIAQWTTTSRNTRLLLKGFAAKKAAALQARARQLIETADSL